MLSIGGGNACYYANLAQRDDYHQASDMATHPISRVEPRYVSTLHAA
jgi:hypothetical protein